MLITKHGKKDPLYKGKSAFNGHNGKPLVFFGWSQKHVELKEDEWLAQHIPVSEVREQAANNDGVRVLRVVKA